VRPHRIPRYRREDNIKRELRMCGWGHKSAGDPAGKYHMTKAAKEMEKIFMLSKK
jgi:hypothetical protein